MNEFLQPTPVVDSDSAIIAGRFADALSCVVEALRKWSTAGEVALNLPDLPTRFHGVAAISRLTNRGTVG